MASGWLMSEFKVGTGELEDSEYPGGGTVGVWKIWKQDLASEEGENVPEPDVFIVHRLMLPDIIKMNKELLEELDRKMDDPHVAVLELPYSENDELLNDAVVEEVFGDDNENGQSDDSNSVS